VTSFPQKVVACFLAIVLPATDLSMAQSQSQGYVTKEGRLRRPDEKATPPEKCFNRVMVESDIAGEDKGFFDEIYPPVEVEEDGSVTAHPECADYWKAAYDVIREAQREKQKTPQEHLEHAQKAAKIVANRKFEKIHQPATKWLTKKSVKLSKTLKSQYWNAIGYQPTRDKKLEITQFSQQIQTKEQALSERRKRSIEDNKNAQAEVASKVFGEELWKALEAKFNPYPKIRGRESEDGWFHEGISDFEIALGMGLHNWYPPSFSEIVPPHVLWDAKHAFQKEAEEDKTSLFPEFKEQAMDFTWRLWVLNTLIIPHLYAADRVQLRPFVAHSKILTQEDERRIGGPLGFTFWLVDNILSIPSIPDRIERWWDTTLILDKSHPYWQLFNDPFMTHVRNQIDHYQSTTLRMSSNIVWGKILGEFLFIYLAAQMLLEPLVAVRIAALAKRAPFILRLSELASLNYKANQALRVLQGMRNLSTMTSFAAVSYLYHNISPLPESGLRNQIEELRHKDQSLKVFVIYQFQLLMFALAEGAVVIVPFSRLFSSKAGQKLWQLFQKNPG